MKIEIADFDQDMAGKWDYFITHSDNGTIFHQRKFLGYHDAEKFEDSSLLFYDRDKIFAAFPSAIIEKEGKRVLYSHPGASYGGFVIGDKIGLEETNEMVKLMLNKASNLKCNSIIITQTPSYYFRKYSSYIDFALHSSGFKLRERELSSVLTLAPSPDGLYKQFPDVLKRALKKASRQDLQVKKQICISEFYEILRNNLSMRHGVEPTHTIEELETLFSLFPEKIKLYAVNQKGEMIGGIITFACNSIVNLAFYIAHDHNFQQFRPVDIAVWEVIKDSFQQGFTYLDFGTFTLNMEPNWGLCRFKEKFGARGVFRDTFERQI